MSEEVATQSRSLLKWVILLLAWIVGLGVYVSYLGLLAALLYRWLGS